MAAGGTAARAVLVIGAHGVLGSALARAFEDAGWRVVRGVRRGDGARDWTAVDLDQPETVAAAIAAVDLVLDPVPHPGLTAEHAVLREGGTLIDVSMRPAAAARRLRAEATSARGTVVVNAGRTPGVSNLVVADLLAAHVLDPLMLWWCLLHALSQLARYHPAEWTAAIDPNQAWTTVPIEQVLELALEVVPRMVLTRLSPGAVTGGS